ncbi:winged helix-turn-helix transcriptional regulator [Halobium salinum]|uniref:Winged helix-turn-helix transcriptional regulator n=1 Tax=Halobium salinum TaxID=1364940 RepID=A0ABD5PI05_9EURY|nr:winged helix-turn-helix transcriptional regulator [Halobium salinum]
MEGSDRDREPSDANDLSLATRREIFGRVKDNPGIHFSQLKRDLDMETGLLQYHLRELEEYGALESEEHQGKRRVFVARELNEEERSILAVLRYETTRRILLYLLENGPARNGEIAEAVGVTPATISYHMSTLADNDIIDSVRDGRATQYEVTNEELVVQLLLRYRESFVDRAVDRIIDFWG